MGISVYDALRIMNRDVEVDVGGPTDDGKYMGWIMGDQCHERWDPVINSEAIYDSEEEAREAMEKLIKEIRAMDKEELLKDAPQIMKDLCM